MPTIAQITAAKIRLLLEPTSPVIWFSVFILYKSYFSFGFTPLFNGFTDLYAAAMASINGLD